MRTFLLILATVVMISVVGGIYVWMQPVSPEISVRARPATTHPVAPPHRSTTDQSQMLIGQGEGASFTIPDEKTNTTAWQFRASRYQPQADNSIDVADPQAEFFFSNGQMIAMKGSRGRVVVPPSASKGADIRGPTPAPSRGELYDVTISLYHMDNRTRPVLVCNVNNVSFDNDTFRIATEAFTQPDGTVVPADQVPVEVRGDDYNFDGRGLTIRWDDKDRHLQSLLVEHGESLEIRSQSMLQGLTPVDASTTKPAPPVAAAPAPAQPRPPAGAAANPRARAGAAAARPAGLAAAPATSPTTKPAATQPVYRATFDGGSPGGVTVERGDQLLAMSDVLQVDLKQEAEQVSMSSGAAAPPPPRPTTRRAPATRRAATTRPRPAARAGAAPASPVPAPAPVQPATAPANDENFEPVIVRWSGRLVVVPLEPADAPNLNPGDRNISMISKGTDNPVVLHNIDESTGKDTVIECASFLYSTADDGLVVHNSADIPIISMQDSEGGSFFTPSMVYHGDTKQAVLAGASRAQIPIVNDQTNKIEILNAKWSQLCVLTLAGANRAQLSMERAVLSGDVDIDHPSIKLKSDQLQVDFEPSAASTTQPATTRPGTKQGSVPKRMIATGGVIADIVDTQQQRQSHIRTDRLEVATEKSPAGQLVPKEMVAIGNVHTFDVDEKQGLWAGRLNATLGATTRPSDPPKVEKLAASENVRFVSTDGAGSSDFLDAVAEEDDYKVTLQGNSAMIQNGDSVLKGPTIVIKPKRQDLEVVGPGTMHGMQPGKSPADKPTPFDAVWDRGLVLHGQENHAEINGEKENVVMTVVSASDGAVNTLSGAKVDLVLMDDPTASTQPAKKPATAAAGATSRPSGMVDSGFTDSFSGLRKKTLRIATVTGDAKLRSVLSGAQGVTLRQLYLESPLMTMDAEAKKFIIPTAGRMLFDQKEPTTQPTTQAATQPAAPATQLATTRRGPGTAPTTEPTSPFASMKGPTAFAWKDNFTFDEALSRANMSGNVQIVHGDDPASQEHFNLLADKVQADFAEDAPATQPDAAGKKPKSEMKLKMLTADGNVHFTSTKVEFTAPQMSFDPVTEVLSARGTADSPVRYWDIGSPPHGSVLSVKWNTRTWDVTVAGAVGQFAR